MAPRKTALRASPPPPAAFDPLRLDVQLCFALYTAGNRITRLYRPLLAPLGITYPQYLALMALWQASPRTLGDLGQALGLDSGTLTPLCKRLESAGLVTRTRDPDDERRLVVALTDKGRALRAPASHVPAAILCQLPIAWDEAAALKAALERLSTGLGPPESSG